METEALIDAVRDYLDDEGYRYDYDAEDQSLELRFNVKCKLKSVRIYWTFKKAGYIVYAIAPITADKDDLGEMLRYVAMANWGLYRGNFEVDCRDGEVRYKCHVSAEGLESLSREVIDISLDVCISMFNRYGDGIAALAMGFSDAETEIKKAESDES